MKLFVITSPEEIENEAEKITTLFKEGLQCLHVRKPNWDILRYEQFIKNIPPIHYKKIVIHSHYSLIEKYNLKGIHFTGKFLTEQNENTIKQMLKNASKRNISISSSMHSIEELNKNSLKFDYIFLSPIFDSISKKDYPSTINIKELNVFLQNYKGTSKIFALGGIDHTNINTIETMGFEGAAILGAVWNSNENPSIAFTKVKTNIINE